MTKEDFIKKFPDIKVQQFETETILSKQEIMDIVEQATRSIIVTGKQIGRAHV